MVYYLPSALADLFLPCGRKPVVCGARADLALEGPARNGTRGFHIWRINHGDFHRRG